MPSIAQTHVPDTSLHYIAKIERAAVSPSPIRHAIRLWHLSCTLKDDERAAIPLPSHSGCSLPFARAHLVRSQVQVVVENIQILLEVFLEILGEAFRHSRRQAFAHSKQRL